MNFIMLSVDGWSNCGTEAEQENECSEKVRRSENHTEIEQNWSLASYSSMSHFTLEETGAQRKGRHRRLMAELTLGARSPDPPSKVLTPRSRPWWIHAKVPVSTLLP